MEQPDATDAELVAETLAGDREAFGRLYDRYARLVRAVAFDVCRDWQSVPDVTQETFMRAYRGLRRLHEGERFGPWLAGIARRVAAERNRARRRDRHVFSDNGSVEQAAPDAAANDAMAWVMDRLADLDERERMAIEAFYLEGRDAAKAAERVGLSRSGVYALLSRAVARLARMAQSPNSETRP